MSSATLDLAYVAMGAFDIWWEGGCWEWDVAAGVALVQEAGGLVTTANPPADPESAAIPEVRLGSRLYLAIRYVHVLPRRRRHMHTTHTLSISVD